MKMLSGRMVSLLLARDKLVKCGVLANMVLSMCSMRLLDRLSLFKMSNAKFV